MSIRKVPFVDNEYYHIYNRGVDKRDIFADEEDLQRFFESIYIFNQVEPVGSIFEQHIKDKNFGGPTPKGDTDKEKLVDIIVYCFNPNHYHFVLKQHVNGGISEFMKRLNGGYTSYFNNKHKRNGSLFQGKFKSIHINTESYLFHVISYVNLNDRVHTFGGPTPKRNRLSKSSWAEYMGINNEHICEKDVIIERFSTIEEYKKNAEETLKGILEKKKDFECVGAFLLE